MPATAKDRAVSPAPKGAIIYNFYAEKFWLRDGLSGRFQIQASIETHDMLMAIGARFRAVGGKIQNEQL